MLSSIFAADKAFARESWPWTLSRQAILTYAGLTESFQPEMERMLGSNQVGPIGYLVAAKWLNRTNPRAATSLARIGLEHLADADFALDVRALMAGGAAGRSIEQWADHLRRLPEREAHDLAEALPAGARAPTDEFIRALGARRAEPIETGLPAALQEAWASSWREAVRKELQALAPVPLNVP